MSVLTITKSNFEETVLKSDKPVLLDFWASDLASEYGITSIPTLIIFRDGRLIDQVTGVTSKASIERMLGL